MQQILESLQKYLTVWSGYHPREGDSSNDTFTEAQQERASLFFLQEGLLFAFAHKTHDVATVQMKSLINKTKKLLTTSQELFERVELLYIELRITENIPIPPQFFKVCFHHH